MGEGLTIEVADKKETAKTTRNVRNMTRDQINQRFNSIDKPVMSKRSDRSVPPLREKKSLAHQHINVAKKKKSEAILVESN